MICLFARITILIDTGLQYVRTRPNGWQARIHLTLILTRVSHHVPALDLTVWLVLTQTTSTAPGPDCVYIPNSSATAIPNVQMEKTKILTSTDVEKGT